MATKVYKVCDNCKHEEEVADENVKLPGWWFGELPAPINNDSQCSDHYDCNEYLLCEGCCIGINSALTLRTKGTRSETAD
jgi:hypothetical protein